MTDAGMDIVRASTTLSMRNIFDGIKKNASP